MPDPDRPLTADELLQALRCISVSAGVTEGPNWWEMVIESHALLAERLAAAETKLAGCRAERESMEGRHALLARQVEQLREALTEIESFPISGYHAGAAQKTARGALAAAAPGEEEKK